MSHPPVSSVLKADFRGINLACGGKLCLGSGWINADHSPSSHEVLRVNFLKPLPFPDKSFDVVYHSQFIEHLPLNKGSIFLRECYRILKPQGVMRVVTPDLRNQASEYLHHLDAVLATPENESAKLSYEWIRLEMLDQLTRHSRGGDMVRFLDESGYQIRDYLWKRMGRSGHNLIPLSEGLHPSNSLKDKLRGIRNAGKSFWDRFLPLSIRVGKFRLSGEAHLFMHDEYSLSMLLRQAGFINIEKVSAMHSRIPEWNKTLLDCDESGYPDGEVSLFMEAAKAI